MYILALVKKVRSGGRIEWFGTGSDNHPEGIKRAQATGLEYGWPGQAVYPKLHGFILILAMYSI